METLSRTVSAQPLRRAARNFDDAPRRASSSLPDNVIVNGFTPPTRERLDTQLPTTRPGWAAAPAYGQRMPVLAAPRRRTRLVPAALVFAGLALMGSGAAVWHIGASDPALAGAAIALAVVLAVAATAFAIGAVVVAARRRLAWLPPAITLLLAVVALAAAGYLAAGQSLGMPLPFLP